MCGIAGFIRGQPIGTLVQENLLNRMLTRIAHRGPDECGLFLSPIACFGSVRLSIIDISSGQQPLSNSNGNLWIAYNGEVFNYVELREMLIQKGHSFKTHCDTEVVLHLYEEYGAAGLSMMNGQFAIAIWDVKKEELFLARDRVGIRPLFYTQKDNQFIFGSEIKSIFEYPNVERAISANALKEVFTFWTTITPHTVFEGVYELPPGHFALYSKGQLKIEKFWALQFANKNNLFVGSFDDAKDQFHALFTDSIKLRLRADVPVAAYLSGGLDSSVTTSYIKNQFPESLNTFSISFEDKSYDESIYQKEVSEYFNTNHHSVTFNDASISELLDKVIWHTEIPLLRTGPIPMFSLSKLVRDNNIKVVVTGEGADEALGGYNIFKEAVIRHFWAKYPGSKIRPMLLKKLYSYSPQLKDASSSVLKMFYGYQLSKTESPIYSHLLRWKNTSNILNHLNLDVKSSIANYDPVANYTESIADHVVGFSPLAKAQYIESSVFMSGYLLSSQGDRVSMGNSVEGRYPFLDFRILEFCATLPDDFKLKGLNEKYLLKELMKNKLPQSVLNRSKQAYRAPIASALLGHGFELVSELTSMKSLSSAGLFSFESVQKLLAKMRTLNQMNEVDSMALMAILSTQILHRQFVADFKYLESREVRKGEVRHRIQ